MLQGCEDIIHDTPTLTAADANGEIAKFTAIVVAFIVTDNNKSKDDSDADAKLRNGSKHCYGHAK